MSLLEALSAQSGLFYLTITLLGLLMGSFLNVVIYRLPKMLQREWSEQCYHYLALEKPEPEKEGEVFNLLLPRSHCPQCGTTIPGWRNIPLLSYLLQRGRCHHCGAPIPWQYPLVELASALLSLFLAWHYGPSIQLIAALFFTWALLALCVIDLRHQLLPDQITLPLLWMGLLFNLQHTFSSLESAVLGAVAGYLALWLLYHLYRLLRNKEGFGYGDFKLLAALGAWSGLYTLPLIILLSSLAGALLGILLVLLRRHRYDQPLSFGPYLAVAGWLALVFGDPLLQAYSNLLAR